MDEILYWGFIWGVAVGRSMNKIRFSLGWYLLKLDEAHCTVYYTILWICLKFFIIIFKVFLSSLAIELYSLNCLVNSTINMGWQDIEKIEGYIKILQWNALVPRAEMASGCSSETHLFVPQDRNYSVCLNPNWTNPTPWEARDCLTHTAGRSPCLSGCTHPDSWMFIRTRLSL